MPHRPIDFPSPYYIDASLDASARESHGFFITLCHVHQMRALTVSFGVNELALLHNSLDKWSWRGLKYFTSLLTS